MEIRDPVHNFIDLNDTEKAIVDQSAFQRLRRIRQLAMADLVYPGAVHHRFEHSIGVCHVAGKIADRMLTRQDDADRRRYVRLAALVHDIGHGPYSHISEEPLAVVNREWLQREKIPPDKIHEQIGLDIIRHQFLEAGIIDRSAYSEITAILDTVHNAAQTVERGIVSGPLDADKMDYLLRDSLFCGVKYGVYDIERLIRALVVIGHGEDAFLGARAEDVAVVDQYVTARFSMTLQVYGHKVRRSTDLMLRRAILSAIQAGDSELIAAYTFEPGSRSFTERYLAFDDRVLMEYLQKSASSPARNLAGRLRERRLPARIWHQPIAEITNTDLQQRLRDEGQQSAVLKEIERRFLEDFQGADPDCVFIELMEAKPVAKFSGTPDVDPEQIIMQPGSGLPPQTLPKFSHFFRDYKPTRYSYLSVYVNLEEGPRETRHDCRHRARRIVDRILKEEFVHAQ